MGGFILSAIIGHFRGLITGLICAVIIAIAKEIMDKTTGKGTPEVLAAVITSLGGLLAYVILGI